MIELVIASAIHAALVQSTAADGARSSFRACLKQASVEAKAQKVASSGFTAFVRQKCAAQESNFKSALWSFDSKNKVSRKQSEADAQVQIEDFLTVAAERYTAPQ